MPIQYFCENITFRLPGKGKRKNWLTSVISLNGYSPGDINYIFCSDELLHGINVEYLNHDTYTDVITFDNSLEVNDITGDIYISIDRVKENADKLSVAFKDELDRVMVHGLLHLLGFGDKTEKETLIMRKKEDEFLSLRAF